MSFKTAFFGCSCRRLDKKVQPATEFADVEALYKAVIEEYGADHMERFVDELVKPCADVLHDIEECKYSCANEEHQSQVCAAFDK